MFVLSAYLYMQDQISFVGVMIPTVALMSSFGPVISLANLGSTLQNTLASGNRVLDILEEKPIVNEIENQEDVSFDGMQVEHVSFGYEQPVLQDISLDISQGSMIGIVGKSGSGKSTLLKLMMRFLGSTKRKYLYFSYKYQSYQHIIIKEYRKLCYATNTFIS